MFLTNLPFNRHESSCMLLSQNGQLCRVAKPGVETSIYVKINFTCNVNLGNSLRRIKQGLQLV
jgi:hypothetical protein